MATVSSHATHRIKAANSPRLSCTTAPFVAASPGRPLPPPRRRRASCGRLAQPSSRQATAAGVVCCAAAGSAAEDAAEDAAAAGKSEEAATGDAPHLLAALRAAGSKIAYCSGDVELLLKHRDRWGVHDAAPSASLVLPLAAASQASSSQYYRKLTREAVREEPPCRRASSQEATEEPHGGGGDGAWSSSPSSRGAAPGVPLRGPMARAADRFLVSLGADLLSVLPGHGRVSTDVDGRFAYNTAAIVDQARRLVDLYGQRGVDASRVLIKASNLFSQHVIA